MELTKPFTSFVQIESICKQRSDSKQKICLRKGGLVTSVFFFSHNVFQNLLTKGCDSCICWVKGENIIGRGENTGYQYFLLFQ